MSQLRLILNGKSAEDPLVREAVNELRERGHSIGVRVTWEAGDAARYAAEAVQDQVDVVVAGGGDGTVNEVATGMLSESQQSRTALAVLPLGTANDFARGCHIPVGDPLSALSLAAEGRATPIDIGKVNERYFVNLASAGFGAEVTVSTPREMKDALGGAAYGLMGLVTALKMKPYPGRLTWSGGEVNGEMLFAAVGNGVQTGGGFRVTPRALLDDGLLDVMIVPDFAMGDLAALTQDLTHLGQNAPTLITYLQLSRFEMESPQPVPMNLDGEPIRDTHFRFEVLPKRLLMVLPEGAPLCPPS